MIKAVVFDIGGVLEVNDDAVFPDPWCLRHGIDREALDAAFAAVPGDAGLGEVTEAELRARVASELSLTEAQSEDLWTDLWRWYVGELDRPLFDWFSGVRARGLKAGILSNSGPGAREQERRWGFEDVVDVLVYSHEVGLKKPDPAVYELTRSALDVDSEQIVFVDDWEPAFEAARASGWMAILHTGDTPATIEALEAVIARR